MLDLKTKGENMANIKNLNESLMRRIEALENEELDDIQLEIEIKRSQAITKVADAIISCARVALDAQKQFDEYATGRTVDIPLLGINSDDIVKENKNLRRRLMEKESYD